MSNVLTKLGRKHRAVYFFKADLDYFHPDGFFFMYSTGKPAFQVLNECMHLSTINMELIHGQTIENKLMFSTVQADSL